MDKESRTSFATPWASGAVMALLLGIGALFVQDNAPYVSQRQGDDPVRSDRGLSQQDVDARLWQDPLGVVQRARDAAKAQNGGAAAAADHSVKSLQDQIESRARSGAGVTVVAVMLRGGPHSEFVEHRRRARYAVLAGASVMGYAPYDADHLGWVQRPPGNALLSQLPQAIPYEWLDLAPDHRGAALPADKRRPASLLLLWLDDRSFTSAPVARMDALAEALTPAAGRTPAAAAWRVIGPGRSDGLLAMVVEGRTRADAKAALSKGRLHFYAATPTVPDETLLNASQPPARDPGCLLGQTFNGQLGIHFTRTIANDAQLVRSLISELELRGLRPTKLAGTEGASNGRSYPDLCRPAGDDAPDAPSHIAVVAEWDTLYGRSLQREFRAEHGVEGYCVERFNYMRGLDGLLPDRAAAPGADAARSAVAKDDARRKDGSFVERAEGQSQFDYLRRLAKHMRERDAELRRKSPDGHGLRAIGVLGNDVHDKLLVLQALRPEFPNAMFFTTDLDARFLHPREQAWARNLIVASSFGLQLDDSLQSGTPPFRDSYQTAVFFTTRLLIDDARRAWKLPTTNGGVQADGCPREATAAWTQKKLNGWLAEPRIFEIGRSRAFDFKGRAPDTTGTPDAPAAGPPAGAASAPSKCRGRQALEICSDIHPPGSAMAPGLNLAGRWIVAALLLSLWLPAWAGLDGGRHELTAWLRRQAATPLRRSGLALLLLLQWVVLPGLLAWFWPALAGWVTRGGKPLVFTEGISLWATEFIRAFALLLGGYLLLRGWRGLQANQRSITERFGFKATQAEVEARQIAAEEGQRWTTWIANMFVWDAVKPRPLRTREATGLSAPAEIVWQRHLVQNRLAARLFRATACVIVAGAVTAAILLVFDEPRFVPQRGDLALNVHAVLHWLVFGVLYFVVFFVADAAALCVSFVGQLRERAVWPLATIRHFEKQLGFRGRALIDHWIDLEFLAMRTVTINKLVYYPFILLTLVLLSGNPAFDDWTVPPGGQVLAGIGVLVALACAVAVRLAAEKSRKVALCAIDQALMQANGRDAAASAAAKAGPGAPTPSQLQQLRDRIARLDDGAFAPYSQQPLLKALLLPFATIGGSTLLEYLRLANL